MKRKNNQLKLIYISISEYPSRTNLHLCFTSLKINNFSPAARFFFFKALLTS